MTRHRLTAAALVMVALAVASQAEAAAETYTVDKVHSEVGFAVRHFVSKTRGRFNDFSGTVNLDVAKPEASSVEFTIQAASIDTGNAKRDAHLKTADFFDVEKFPTLTFKSKSVKKTGPDAYDVTGDLTIHGVTKEIVLPVRHMGTQTDSWGNLQTGFEAATRVNRKDYGIVWNQTIDAGGVVLGDDVDVVLDIAAVKKAAGDKPAAAKADDKAAPAKR